VIQCQKSAMNLCLFISAGTQVPPQLMEVHSSGLIESVSTDLNVLSRGFIPGGIVATSGVESRFIVGYRNPTYKSGIPIPPIEVLVRDEAVSKRRNSSMSVCIGGDSSPASAHGSPLKWNH